MNEDRNKLLLPERNQDESVLVTHSCIACKGLRAHVRAARHRRFGTRQTARAHMAAHATVDHTVRS